MQVLKTLLLKKLSTALHTLVPGNPLDPSTTLGPLARKSCLDQVTSQVTRGLSCNATIIEQRSQNQPTGYFYPPTLIELTDSNNNLWSEEIFGPCTSVYDLSL